MEVDHSWAEGPATAPDIKDHYHKPHHYEVSPKKKLKAAVKRHFDRKSSMSLRNLHQKLGKERLLMFLNKEETGKEAPVFANGHTPLVKIQESVGKAFGFEGNMGQIFFPIEKKYQYVKETGKTEVINNLTLIDTQAMYEKAFTLWNQRAFKSQKKR